MNNSLHPLGAIISEIKLKSSVGLPIAFQNGNSPLVYMFVIVRFARESMRLRSLIIFKAIADGDKIKESVIYD